MAVNVTDVQVLDNPACFTQPIQFEISFECLTALEQDLEWKVIYVGSAESQQHDQELDCVQVGPVQPGFMKFVFEVDPPDPQLIPVSDLLEVTVVLLTCSYRGKEFIRVGYYVANEYVVDELKENPPSVPQLDKIQRHILADQPRVTKWQIPWDEPTPLAQQQPDQSTTATTATTTPNHISNATPAQHTPISNLQRRLQTPDLDEDMIDTSMHSLGDAFPPPQPPTHQQGVVAGVHM